MSHWPVRLVSTDFDGTLIGHPSDGRCVPSLARALSEFKDGGGLWALNTGRSLPHAIEGVEAFDAPVEPDFLLTHEREIYWREPGGGWVDAGEWNAICRARHARLFDKSGQIFPRIRELLAGNRDVRWIREDDFSIGLVTSDEAAMARIARNLDGLRAEFPEFGYQRNTIYLRFCHADYHKGASLRELCRQLELRPEETFAAGDHFNDLPMLDPQFARHLACPSNAIAPVKKAVRDAGGWVAEAPAGEGIAEALIRLKTQTPAALREKPPALGGVA
jgi:hydroxymethylpyrimidine pyrophosphatase-like HAD family hydrolase